MPSLRDDMEASCIGYRYNIRKNSTEHSWVLIASPRIECIATHLGAAAGIALIAPLCNKLVSIHVYHAQISISLLLEKDLSSKTRFINKLLQNSSLEHRRVGIDEQSLATCTRRLTTSQERMQPQQERYWYLLTGLSHDTHQ
eukprot:GHVU01173992.1.p1 GENE.GHVU01173992.1~~GHVU01173992.1.p1  ORF type:complete len:142 (-),score=6.15 GHVU01173992.1:22-447(-)